MTTFQKASKKQAKLRLAIFGASGTGKTYTALSIATGLGKKIALIDTERKSASKYADRFDFMVADLHPANIDSYVSFIEMAEGHDVLIIDSLSHGWQELLAEVDVIAKAKYRGNTWSAWSEGTPRQKKLVNAILGFNGHVIATMRCKTEWLVEKDERTGKNKPVRLGTSPEQGKGIEYEFDMLIDMNTEHIANILKDRTGKFQDKFLTKPGKEFGKELYEWLNSGEKVKSPQEILDEKLREIEPTENGRKALLKSHTIGPNTPEGFTDVSQLNPKQVVYVLGRIA